MSVDEIGEQYIKRSIASMRTQHNATLTTQIHIYIQQFSIVRLQDTNLLIPSSDWSINYLLELFLNCFPFQLLFRSHLQS